jgi:hypothetical protein
MKKTYYPQSFEKIGFIPRSILRTLGRFRRQLFPGVEELVIKEFRISRNQLVVSIKSLVLLMIIPIFFNFFGKQYLLEPSIEYFWNTRQTSVFLNSSQEKRALTQLNNFEEKLYFESLILPEEETYGASNVFIEQKMQQKYLDLADQFNEESIDGLSNLLMDFLTLFLLCFLFKILESEISILISFLTEFFYSFGDTTKSFLVIFITDLLVGFHSPHGWEVFLAFIMNHFGFSENEDFSFLFVATFPVFLDTLMKYWIFRYLNRLSPSTVATYHTMIE